MEVCTLCSLGQLKLRRFLFEPCSVKRQYNSLSGPAYKMLSNKVNDICMFSVSDHFISPFEPTAIGPTG